MNDIFTTYIREPIHTVQMTVDNFAKVANYLAVEWANGVDRRVTDIDAVLGEVHMEHSTDEDDVEDDVDVYVLKLGRYLVLDRTEPSGIKVVTDSQFRILTALYSKAK